MRLITNLQESFFAMKSSGYQSMKFYLWRQFGNNVGLWTFPLIAKEDQSELLKNMFTSVNIGWIKKPDFSTKFQNLAQKVQRTNFNNFAPNGLPLTHLTSN